VRDGRTRQLRLELATRAVLDHDAARLDRARAVREVVRDDLVAVQEVDRDPAVLLRLARERGGRLVDEGRGRVDGGVRCFELLGHGRRCYRRVTKTLTSGGT